MSTKGKSIKSSELRKGDLIQTHGCTVRINEVKSRKDEDEMPIFWSVATVIENGPHGIPSGYLDTAANGSRTWTIQGNDRASWWKVNL